MDHRLNILGWCDFFENQFGIYEGKGWMPARVITRSVDRYRLMDVGGEFDGILSGKYLHGMEKGIAAPAVGDWAAVERKGGDILIHAMLKRKSCFSRKPAISGGRKLKRGMIDGGMTAEQVLAANIDIAFIVAGLDGDINRARIERYYTAAMYGGVSPVLLLNKADLCPDAGPAVAGLKPVTKERPVHVVSASSGLGLEELRVYLVPGSTVAFLGPSGAGKSTLVNRLFGIDLQETKSVNEATGKGRHTTTRADLFVHESGCMLIDTPGIRELQLWCDSQAVEESFDDVVELISRCRFSDCGHRNEPGCAVKEALRAGLLTMERYESYRKLYSETRHLEARKKQWVIVQGRKRKRFTSF